MIRRATESAGIACPLNQLGEQDVECSESDRAAPAEADNASANARSVVDAPLKWSSATYERAEAAGPR